MLSLTCYLLGDNVKRHFIVKIEEDETVSILKDLIKEKKTSQLKDVDASDLDIWKVDLPILNLKKSLDKIGLDDDNSLSQVQKLSEVFLNLVSDHLHVIAKAPGTSRQSSLSEPLLTPVKVIQTAAALDPTQLLSLNCLLLRDDPDRMFTVEIPKNKNVSILKDLIKEKNPSSLGNVDVKNIDLWQVSVLVDDLHSKKPSTAGPKLRSDKLLSDVFPSELVINHVHVVARPPGQGEYDIDFALMLLIITSLVAQGHRHLPINS